MKRSFRIIPIAAVPVVVVLVILAGCSSNAQPVQQVSNTPVRTAEVAHEIRSLPIRTGGKLSPKTQIQLSFKTGGLIEQIYVDEGDRVKAGQLLARLDMAEIDAQVQQAQSSFEKSKRDADRMDALYRDSVVTLEQLQNTQTALDVSQAALRIANFNRKHSEIRAPSDGRILRRMVEANELVTPGKSVLELGASRGWVVRAGLADRDIVKLKLGDLASLRFDAYPGQSFSGWLSEIAEAADPMTGTFEVEVTVEDTQGFLKAGFITQIDLLPSNQEPFFYIPIEALVDGDGMDGVVYVLDEETTRVHKTPVRIAHILQDTLAISSGLETVTAVVTDGAAYLSDGIAVDVVQ